MKNFIIATLVSAIIFIPVTVILLMIMIPQTKMDEVQTSEKYVPIEQENYKFDNTKNITSDTLTKEYSVTNGQLDNYENKNLYVPGNANPFTPKDDLNSDIEDTDDDDTDGKTDNSNSGTDNDSSTGK